MIFQSPLRGISFLDIDAKLLVADLKIGDRLTLQRVLDNEYDANAIAVYFGDTRVGWVAKGVAANMAGLMDAGATFTCRVSAWEAKTPQLIMEESDASQVEGTAETNGNGPGS